MFHCTPPLLSDDNTNWSDPDSDNDSNKSKNSSIWDDKGEHPYLYLKENPNLYGDRHPNNYFNRHVDDNDYMDNTGNPDRDDIVGRRHRIILDSLGNDDLLRRGGLVNIVGDVNPKDQFLFNHVAKSIIPSLREEVKYCADSISSLDSSLIKAYLIKDQDKIVEIEERILFLKKKIKDIFTKGFILHSSISIPAILQPGQTNNWIFQGLYDPVLAKEMVKNLTNFPLENPNDFGWQINLPLIAYFMFTLSGIALSCYLQIDSFGPGLH